VTHKSLCGNVSKNSNGDVRGLRGRRSVLASGRRDRAHHLPPVFPAQKPIEKIGLVQIVPNRAWYARPSPFASKYLRFRTCSRLAYTSRPLANADLVLSCTDRWHRTCVRSAPIRLHGVRPPPSPWRGCQVAGTEIIGPGVWGGGVG